MTSVGRLLVRALRIDLFDLNAAFDPDRLDDILLMVHSSILKPGLVRRMAMFIYHAARSALRCEWRFPRHIDSSRPLVFVCTKNQEQSVQPLVDRLPGTVFVGAWGFGRIPYPIAAAHLISVIYLPIVLWQFVRSNRRRRRSFTFAFEEYWLAYGHYVVSHLLLARLRPSILIVTNDHLMLPRTLLVAAKEQGIPTCYVQHASVSQRFPALMFDLAFLDGRDAAVKYDRPASAGTQCFLTGIAKFDAYHGLINTRERVQTLGICVNDVDPMKEIGALCCHIRSELPELPIVLRPHPIVFRKRAREWSALAQRYGCLISDPVVETSFAFLNKVDAIVVGESNITLEAALLNVVPIYFAFAGHAHDIYGFFSCGLVDRCEATPEEVVTRLRELIHYKPSWRARASRYCATIGTPYDGRSTDLMLEVLRQFLAGHVAMNGWRKVDGLNYLHAYAPATIP